MVDIEDELEEIDIDGTHLSLAVGWTVGKNTKIRQIDLGKDVESAFRTVARDTLADLSGRESAPWTPDADLSPETFLVLDVNEVGDAPKLTSDHNGEKFLEILKKAETLETINPKHLPTGDLTFYAIVIGNPGERTVFIRRSNPRRGLKRGRIYSTLSDTLQRVEDPIFAFDDWVDLVVTGDRLSILSQTVFAAFFRDQETLAKKIPEWVKQLQASVPFTVEGAKVLEERTSRDSRLKARLEAIVRRDHLAQVPFARLKQAMLDNELDPNRLMDSDGNIQIEYDDVPQILYLLNEDLFTGSLTSTGFRADKKASR